MEDSGDSPSSNKKPVILETPDKTEIEEDFDVAMESTTIKNFYEAKLSAVDPSDSHIRVPILTVSGDTLGKVLEYQKLHRDLKLNCASAKEFKALSAKFCEEDKETKISLLNAVNYLNFEDLFEFILQAMADQCNTMSIQEIREFFSVENDYTAIETEQFRRTNYWAFEVDDEDVEESRVN